MRVVNEMLKSDMVQWVILFMDEVKKVETFYNLKLLEYETAFTELKIQYKLKLNPLYFIESNYLFVHCEF